MSYVWVGWIFASLLYGSRIRKPDIRLNSDGRPLRAISGPSAEITGMAAWSLTAAVDCDGWSGGHNVLRSCLISLSGQNLADTVGFMAAKAYSYSRFSRPEQMRSDSLRRQTEAAEKWAAANGMVIDESLTDWASVPSGG